MTTYTVMGPGGAPSRPPYGAFAGKPPFSGRAGIFTVMGPAGAPSRPPWASFAGKPAAPIVIGLPHNQPFINATMGRMFSR